MTQDERNIALGGTAKEGIFDSLLQRQAVACLRGEPIPSSPVAEGDVPLHGFDPGPFIGYTKGLQNLVAHQQAQIAKLEQTVTACRAVIASGQFPADNDPETALNQLRYDRASGGAMLSGALSFIAGESRGCTSLPGEAAKWWRSGWDTARECWIGGTQERPRSATEEAQHGQQTAPQATGEIKDEREICMWDFGLGGKLEASEAQQAQQAAPPDNSPEAVTRRLDGVCADLMSGRTTPEQRRGLRSTTDRADRVTPGSDAAVGRAIG